MRRDRAYVLMLGLCVVGGAVVAFTMRPGMAWAEEDDDEDDVVHELMEKTHEGKNSPWKKAERAASKDPLDWAALNTALPALSAMSDALAATKNKEVRDSADGYIDAVKELAAQAKKQDAAASRAALKSLANACTDCHYKDGPGGELDD